jgi:hypothetical protein
VQVIYIDPSAAVTSIDTTRRHYAFESNARRRATMLAYEPQASESVGVEFRLAG